MWRSFVRGALQRLRVLLVLPLSPAEQARRSRGRASKGALRLAVVRGLQMARSLLARCEGVVRLSAGADLGERHGVVSLALGRARLAQLALEAAEAEEAEEAEKGVRDTLKGKSARRAARKAGMCNSANVFSAAKGSYVGNRVIVDAIIRIHDAAAAAATGESFDAPGGGADNDAGWPGAAAADGDGTERTGVHLGMAVGTTALYVPLVCRKWRACEAREEELRSCLDSLESLQEYVQERREMLERIEVDLKEMARGPAPESHPMRSCPTPHAFSAPRLMRPAPDITDAASA